jgi:hypothetical protein
MLGRHILEECSFFMSPSMNFIGRRFLSDVLEWTRRKKKAGVLLKRDFVKNI